MKKLVLITGFLIGCIAPGFSQNYISGTVSLYGASTASGTTIVAPGASFYLHYNRFFEQADFINQGDSTAISANNAALILNGNTLQTISGRFSLGALRLMNHAGAVINNTEPVTMLTILDSVSFGRINNTSLDAGNGLMTLRSTPLKTARIADITHNDINTGNAISGSVVAERYIQDKRAWRLLGPPTTADSVNSQTIKQAWQEGATAPRGQVVNPVPGYGTVISRPGNNPLTATGYDDGVPYSYTYSLRMYTSNGLLTQPPNTDFTHFSAHAAYLLQVRGDRSVQPEVQSDTYQTPPTATTLRSTGALHNGTVTDTITNASGSFAGIGNPYACTVDFSKVNLNGVANGFYVWDPNIGTLGAWVYIDGTDNYNATPEVPDSIGAYTNPATNSLIQSGQAILVKTIGTSGIVTFKESSKEAANRADVFRQMPLPSLKINLYSEDSGNYVFTDGTAVVFDASYTQAALPTEDIYKPGNITENLSFYTNGSFLMKEKWPMPVANDTLPLQLWKTSVKKYRFAVTSANMATALQAFLLDKYLHTTTALTASGSTNYDFDINSDAASKVTERFAIVFGESVLPVTFTHIKAVAESDGIMVEWNVENEMDIAHYEVEKATDGKTFTKIGTVVAKGGSAALLSYNLLDAQPQTGDNYYRVKSVDAGGKFTYTSIVKITIKSSIMTVTVVPNPVKNNVLKILFTNASAGQYNIILYSNDGKKVFQKSIDHLGGGATYTFSVAALAKGVYQLQIQGNDSDKEKRTISVIIE